MAFIDFIFQNGEYSQSKDVFDYIDIFLDPIIIIITFTLGFWLSNYSIKKKENIELDSLFDYFKLYVKNQNNQISKQIIEIEKQLINVSNLKNIGGLGIILVQPIDFILEGINKQLLLKSWKMKGLDEQNLFNVLKFYNYTKLNFENYQVYHSEFIRKQNELREEWNSKIKLFHDYKLSISNKPKDELLNNKEFVFLNKVYNDWSNLKNMPLEFTIEKIVKPLEEHFSKIFNETPENNFASSVLEKVQAIDIVYLKWKSEIKVYKLYLEVILPDLKKGLEEMEETKF